MKKNITILILLFSTISIYGIGLKKNGDFIIVPEVFNSYCKADIIKGIENGTTDLNSLDQVPGGANWVVYSDREDNIVHFKEGLNSSKATKLKFLEPLNVKNVYGSNLLVYSRSSGTEGWISAKNLILNSYALLNSNSIPKKAMALISLTKEQAKKLDSIPNINEFKLYSDPDIKKQKGKANKFEIYYVLKEVAGKKLLSRIDKLTGSQIALEANVAGWMINFHITNWDSRLCLEISSKAKAQAAYGDLKIPVYPRIEDLKEFIELGTENTDGAIMRALIPPSRPPANIMRMPVLKTDKSDFTIKEVATVGSLGNAIPPEEIAKIKTKIQDAKNKLENVNIVFIIDGTSSMGPYYQSVANSVKKIIEKNNDLSTNNKLRFGAVIYRDYADGNNAVQVERLTGNHQTIIDFILGVKAVGVVGDKDLPEAQYNGIIKGLDQVGLKQNQSNIIVLIGDCGNHSPDPEGITLDQVCKKIKDFEASLITFQVVSGKDQSYTDFSFDAQDMLLNTGILYSKTPKSVKLIKTTERNTYKLNFTSIKNPSVDVQDLYMFGRFTYASGSSAMSTSILENNIVGTTKEYFEWVENTKAMLENILTGQFSDKYSTDMIEYLKKYWGLTDADIEKLKNLKEISFLAHTSTRFYNKDEDCYIPVVFISQNEIKSISEAFSELKDPGEDNIVSRKNALKLALLEQTKKMLGEVSDDNILNKSLNEIWEIILGIPFDNKRTYGNMAMVKLRDLNKIDDQTFEKFIADFEKKIKYFNVNTFSQYSFQSGSQFFYWVPLSSFPGND
jgi:hypothetical protein